MVCSLAKVSPAGVSLLLYAAVEGRYCLTNFMLTANNCCVCYSRVSDASGKLEVKEVGGKPLKFAMLDTNVSSCSTLSPTLSSLSFQLNLSLCLALSFFRTASSWTLVPAVSTPGLAKEQQLKRRRTP